MFVDRYNFGLSKKLKFEVREKREYLSSDGCGVENDLTAVENTVVQPIVVTVESYQVVDVSEIGVAQVNSCNESTENLQDYPLYLNEALSDESCGEAVKTHEPRCLTFVSPTCEKGLEFAAALFRELANKKVDVPILLVQGRASLLQAARSIGKFDDLKIKIVRGPIEPTAFYRVTRVLLMPSLEEETFGRVIVEAGLNHIPTLCSDRGALPETVGTGGFALPIPARFDSCYRGAIESSELSLWTGIIASLWNCQELYDTIA